MGSAFESGLDDSGGCYGDARGLFIVGDDLWSFGAGIAHCKGPSCSNPRR